MIYIIIKNIEKKKLFFKLKIEKIIELKNIYLRIYIKKEGCYGFKYKIYKEKLIKKNDIIIKKKKFNINRFFKLHFFVKIENYL